MPHKTLLHQNIISEKYKILEDWNTVHKQEVIIIKGPLHIEMGEQKRVGVNEHGHIALLLA